MNRNQIPDNPFIAGQPARGSDFFGREDDLLLIEQFIMQEEKDSFFIKGQRRSGKTSFLKRSQDKFKSEKNLILYFNLQDKISHTSVEIAQEIQERIIRYTDKINISFNKDFKNFLKNLKNKVNRKVILLFDEFDVMCKNSKNDEHSEHDFVNFILDIIIYISENKIPVKLIFAAGSNYESEISKHCKKIEDLSIKVVLTPFEKGTVDKLLETSRNLPFRENAKETINELTSGNPFFTQALAYSVYDFAQSHKAQSITPKMVKNRLNSAVRSFGSGVAVIWNDLENTDKIILYSLANIIEKDQKSDLNVLKEYLTKNFMHIDDKFVNESFLRLEKSGFINQEKSKINFKTEFFRKWIVLDINKREIRDIHTSLKKNIF
jgi:AAA+ ATPase superfamily predicted ATPase